MRKALGLIATVCCACALCFSLAGCLGASVDKSLYTGEWTLVSSNNDNLDEKTVEFLRSIKAPVELNLKEDGSGSLRLPASATKSVTWTAKSNTEGTVTLDGDELKMTLNNEQITLTDSAKVTLTFARESAVEAASSNSASAASTSASSASTSSASNSEGSASADASAASEESSSASSEAA